MGRLFSGRAPTLRNSVSHDGVVVTWEPRRVYNIPVTRVLVIIFAVLLLAACGEDLEITLIPPPTSTPAPTSLPTSTPTASPTLDGAAAPTATSKPAPTATPILTPMPTAAPAAEGDAKIKQYSQPPPMTINPENRYVATMNTNKGAIVIELFSKEAPKTVNNFVFLARDSFYDGVIFHRVIPVFMIQGGDPNGTGTGGPGYKFEDEFDPSLVFDRPGILAMANSGPNTNGSQFFITVAPTPHLNNRHTIFGRVIEGEDVANAISVVPSAQDRPVQDVVIQNIEIQETEPGG